MQSNDSEKQPKLESGLQAALDELQEIDAHWDPNTSPDRARKAMDQLESILKKIPNTAQLVQAVLPRILAANKAMDMITYILSKLVAECKRQEDDSNRKLIGSILENILKMKGLVEGLPFCFAAGVDQTNDHGINEGHMRIIVDLLALLPNRYEIFATVLAHPEYVFTQPPEKGTTLHFIIYEAFGEISQENSNYLKLAKALASLMKSDEAYNFQITEQLTYLWAWLINHKNSENAHDIPLVRAMIMTKGNYLSPAVSSFLPSPDKWRKPGALSMIVVHLLSCHGDELLSNDDNSVTIQCLGFIKELIDKNPKQMNKIDLAIKKRIAIHRGYEEADIQSRLMALSRNPGPDNVKEAEKLFLEFLVPESKQVPKNEYGSYSKLADFFTFHHTVYEEMYAGNTGGTLSSGKRTILKPYTNVLITALATNQTELAKVFLRYIAITEQKIASPVLLDVLVQSPKDGDWKQSAWEMIKRNPEMLLFMDSDPTVSSVFIPLRLSRLKQTLEGRSSILGSGGEDLLSSCPVRSDDPRVKERLFTMLEFYLIGVAGVSEPSNDKKAEMVFKLFRERGLKELASFLTLQFKAPNPDIGALLEFELGGFPNDYEILSLADADPARIAAIVDNDNGVNLLSIALGSQQTDLVKVILRTAVTVEAGLEDMADALSEEQKAQVSEIIQKDPELIVILPLQQLVQKREEEDTTGCAIM